MHEAGTENKHTGSFYTPAWCVDMMLDMSGFDELFSARANKKRFRIADPACGDGAMLTRTCNRIINLMRKDGSTSDGIARFIEDNVYGFELDEDEAGKAKNNIVEAAGEHGILLDANRLNVFTGDAFETTLPFYHSFDYVIGNPPYVRIHNLDEKPDSPYIEGMCDLYLAFYDLGQRLLNEQGRLAFIAPSSWMTSRAGKAMRQDLMRTGRLASVLDFKHYQVFGNATAYTAVSVLDAQGADEVAIFSFDEQSKTCFKTGTRDARECWIEGCFYADADKELADILGFDEEALDEDVKEHIRSIEVRNGYATMRDATFISKEARFPGSSIEIPVVKASTSKHMFALYPHGKDGALIPLVDIRATSSAAYDVLCDDKDALLARNKVDAAKWWGYGRTQGIADTYKDKVSVQSTVHPEKPCHTCDAHAGTGVFGGLYVLGMDKDELDNAVADAAFWGYVQSLAKYKSGGYYAFGGKDLQRYLRWWSARRKQDSLQ